MIITYYGKEAFKVQLGDLTIALNPVSKKSKSGVKPTRFGANIGLVSLNHPDFNGVDGLSYGDKEPFLIDGPGEYEVKGVVIKGFLVKTEYEKEEKINTIYYLTIDGMHLCFLGAVSDVQISGKIRELMGVIDITFVPIGGGDVLDASSAHRISRSLNSKIIIPMDYKDAKAVELKKFLEETGAKNGTAIDKLTIKKKDLEGKEGEVVVLSVS